MSEFQNTEEWRPIPDVPAYSVSNHGRIRRETTTQGGKAGRIINCSPQTAGYMVMQFYTDRNTRKMRLVHHLVMETFIGPRPLGYEVNHKNGVRDDNRLENLEYCTRKENVLHSLDELGHRKSRLTDGAIIAIRWLYRHRNTQRTIGRMFGVSQVTIHNIITRKTWSHVPEDPAVTTTIAALSKKLT